MPTRRGDVVVSCTGVERSRCSVWSVEADGQQSPHPSTYVSTAYSRDAALTLVTIMGGNGWKGTMFLLDRDTLTWTTQPG
jgi:hypothetical protein